MIHCCYNHFYFFQQFFSGLINKCITEIFKYKLCGIISRMYQVLFIKPVITQYINYQFISRKIKYILHLFSHRMNCFDEPCFTPVIFYNTVSYMPYRTYSKNNFQFVD